MKRVAKKPRQPRAAKVKRYETVVKLAKKLLAAESRGFGDCLYCSVSTGEGQSMARVKHDESCLLQQLRRALRECKT